MAAEVPGPCVWLSSVCQIQLEHGSDSHGQQGSACTLVRSPRTFSRHKENCWKIKIKLSGNLSHFRSVKILWHQETSSNHFIKKTSLICVLRDDDEEDGEKAAQQQNNRSMLSYFSASAEGDRAQQTHRFFSERRLKSLKSLWKGIRTCDSYPGH